MGLYSYLADDAELIGLQGTPRLVPFTGVSGFELLRVAQ
jgi:hypothetical protein